MMNELNQVQADIAHITDVGNELASVIKKLQDKDLNSPLAKEVAIIYAKLRIQMFDKVLQTVSLLKNRMPELQNNADILLLFGKWDAEREEARDELSNLNLTSSFLGVFNQKIQTCFHSVTEIVNSINKTIAASLSPNKETATIVKAAIDIQVAISSIALKFYEEYQICGALPEDSPIEQFYNTLKTTYDQTLLSQQIATDAYNKFL